MKKVFKYIGLTLMVLSIIGVASLLYWEREQTINFAEILPSKMSFCSKTITSNDAEYKLLYKWFESNSKGWQNTLITFVPRKIISSPNLSINLFDEGVIVNYSTKANKWHQVERAKKKSELVTLCKTANKKFEMDVLTPSLQLSR